MEVHAAICEMACMFHSIRFDGKPQFEGRDSAGIESMP